MKPLNSSGRLVCQDLDEIRPGLVSRGFYRVIVELLDAVLDLSVDLGPGKSSVDSGCLCSIRTALQMFTNAENLQPLLSCPQKTLRVPLVAG